MVKTKAKILMQTELTPGIYDLVLKVPEIAKEAEAGQFVNIYLKNESKLLPRPISICGIDKEAGTIRLVYRILREGSGTEEFSKYAGSDGAVSCIASEIELMGPLGNSFPIVGKRPLLIGGGIGIPPMLCLAKKLKKEGLMVHAALGYRSGEISGKINAKNLYLYDELEARAEIAVSTDDGTFGTKGNVLDAIREAGWDSDSENKKAAQGFDVIYACGPLPMLKGVKTLGEKWGIPTYISMEERMACGIGACLACVCKTTKEDSHSHVHNARVCKEGPVFLAEDIDL